MRRNLVEIELVVMSNPQAAVDAWIAAGLERKREVQRDWMAKLTAQSKEVSRERRNGRHHVDGC